MDLASLDRPGAQGASRTGSVGPRFGVVGLHRVDQVGLVVFAPAAARGVGVDLVHASSDPADPASGHLVAHRIGERLGGRAAVDLVPVVVQQGVQGPQREAAMLSKDGATARTQAAPPQLDRLRKHGWEGDLLGVGGLASGSVSGAGPQLVSELIEAADHLDPARGERVQFSICVGQLHHQLGTLGLEPDPIVPQHSLDPPQRLVLAVPLLGSSPGGTDRGSDRVVDVHRSSRFADPASEGFPRWRPATGEPHHPLRRV